MNQFLQKNCKTLCRVRSDSNMHNCPSCRCQSPISSNQVLKNQHPTIYMRYTSACPPPLTVYNTFHQKRQTQPNLVFRSKLPKSIYRQGQKNKSISPNQRLSPSLRSVNSQIKISFVNPDRKSKICVDKSQINNISNIKDRKEYDDNQNIKYFHYGEQEYLHDNCTTIIDSQQQIPPKPKILYARQSKLKSIQPYSKSTVSSQQKIFPKQKLMKNLDNQLNKNQSNQFKVGKIVTQSDFIQKTLNCRMAKIKKDNNNDNNNVRNSFQGKIFKNKKTVKSIQIVTPPISNINSKAITTLQKILDQQTKPKVLQLSKQTNIQPNKSQQLQLAKQLMKQLNLYYDYYDGRQFNELSAQSTT